jgi:hypothetical protein
MRFRCQVVRGAVLLKLMAASFAPSQALENYVELWMRSFAPEYRSMLQHCRLPTPSSSSSTWSASQVSASLSGSQQQQLQQQQQQGEDEVVGLELIRGFGEVMNDALQELHRTVFRGTARAAVSHEAIEGMLAPLVIITGGAESLFG